MVWGLPAPRAMRCAMWSIAAYSIVSAVAPCAALAQPQSGGAQVAYFDPTIVNPQAKAAALSASRPQQANAYALGESYPEQRMAYAAPRGQQARIASQSRPKVDQKNFVKIGAPYRQNGVWYVPANEPNYDEVGTASWYGAEFHGKYTSNGEVYDMNAITAAHPTLPLPSIVEVTNLETGKTLKVRVNDRGPFVKGRLIDLSPRAAKALGYYGKGSAKVRVRYVGAADAADENNLTAIAPQTFGGRLQSAAYTPPTTPLRVAPAIRSAQLPPVQKSAAIAKSSSAAKAGRYLQVGAFSSAANADKLSAKLNGGRVAPLEQGGATLYRVLVGPLPDEAAMALAKAQATNLGVPNPRTVTLN